METALDALIGGQSPRGDARVEEGSAELTTQIQTLHRQCYGWAMACCGYRHDDAEDVLQDVYVGVLNGGLTFNGHSTFRTWLFGVIRHKARARLRRERLRRLLGIRHAARIDTPTPARDPGDQAAAADRRDRTRTALQALPRRQREVLLLVFYHDLTLEDAAKVMTVSIGSARVHYDRAKKRLAALLATERS